MVTTDITINILLIHSLDNTKATLNTYVSYESMKKNMLENYTYHTNPDIANTKTKVYLWCGSKEPYALKSHKILKKYLKDYEEEIMKGLGHGEFFLKHQDEMCKKLTNVYKNK